MKPVIAAPLGSENRCNEASSESPLLAIRCVSSTAATAPRRSTATSQLDTPLAFAALFALAALGILVYLAVEIAEWLLAPLLPHKAGHE